MPDLNPEDPQPGLYVNVPMAVYLKIKAVSTSMLKNLAISPAKCRYAIDNPDKDDTEAKIMGRALHAAILEPDLYDERWLVCPEGMDRRTKAGKAEWADLQLQAMETGGEIIKHKDAETVTAVRDAVMADEIAGQLMESKRGGNEVTLIWKDEATGLMCKGRSDRMTDYQGFTVHIDLKSTKDASVDGYKWEVRRYKYHWSAAFYLDGCDALEPGKRRFLHIAFEKVPPYDVGVYEFEPAVQGEINQISLDEGRDFYRRHLTTYKQCLESGIWPSYGGIHPLYI